MLLPHRSSAFGHLHTRAATRLLDLCSREDDSSLARSRRMESGRDPMTSASGKSRAVKDPARCSRAVNMTVTAAPVANGQSWVLREKGSPRSKKATRRVEAARPERNGSGTGEAVWRGVGLPSGCSGGGGGFPPPVYGCTALSAAISL